MSDLINYNDYTNIPSPEKKPLFCKKKPFSCRFCHKNFQTESILAVHAEKAHHSIMRKERKDRERLGMATAFGYPCKVCQRLFASAADRGAHERTAHTARGFSGGGHHTDSNDEDDIMSTITSAASTTATNNTAASSSSTTRTPSSAALPQLSNRNNTNANRPFTCDVCARTFVRLSHLTSHAQIHSAEKLFKCSECGKSFLRAASLTEHIQSHTKSPAQNEVEKYYTCDVCNKTFLKQSVLLMHKKIHETTPMPLVDKPRSYECEVCHRKFAYLYSLTAHQVIHNPLKKAYTCTTCKRSFQNMVALSSHVKGQHMKMT
ncbi:zinc finger protein 98 [Octopus bimaculoides]|uniref:C2H2-type domain-containing protein n=1 Tax=Octopus bimaculoides TaxID=37653 RepID=A0A0L8GJS8_OCTBM|nr:zinc finger protein 98 [Octopus bimaculoides]XP_014780433.1 zinc finger protein 98 [Octopus bimaculoides]XP_052831018.1 zinc finger protein 98 [Octopus bimaculoides]XP_052831019.1 zinc finger protein 98 [Octopus bimaculoides]|eukprot:XP_014780432.1 PREDICTED: zinc finger protein 98-like [Octopus bimaculoides]